MLLRRQGLICAFFETRRDGFVGLLGLVLLYLSQPFAVWWARTIGAFNALVGYAGLLLIVGSAMLVLFLFVSHNARDQLRKLGNRVK